MTRPEPARTLWRKHQAAIKKLADNDEGVPQLMLDGGTMLAATWKHRVRSDIHVLLPEHQNVVEGHTGGSADLAAATGGLEGAQWENRIRVTLPEGSLDICAARPLMPGLERREPIENGYETVAPAFRTNLNRLGHDAARAVEDNPYQHVPIALEPDAIVIER